MLKTVEQVNLFFVEIAAQVFSTSLTATDQLQRAHDEEMSVKVCARTNTHTHTHTHTHARAIGLGQMCNSVQLDDFHRWILMG